MSSLPSVFLLLTRRPSGSACCLHQYAPELHLLPKQVLIDEKVQIIANGLHAKQEVTLCAHMVEAEREYGSCGHYIASDTGVVDMMEDVSKGGTYAGAQPMGLFWSMVTKPGIPTRRLTKSDVMTPYDVTISVLKGFCTLDDLPWTSNGNRCLASGQLLRSYSKPGIERVPIEEDGVYGTMFFPSGDGPFPAVIDMFGLTNERNEFRSALLASRGIASFAIRYVGYKDLPTSDEDRAFDYLASHPKVDPKALGGIATCGGAAFLFLIASKRPSMKCLVAINGVLMPFGSTQTVEGEVVEAAKFDFSNATIIDGKVAMQTMYVPGSEKLFLPAWRHGAKMLLIHGLGDQCASPRSLQDLRQIIPEKHLQSVTMLTYPGAGHLLEPPYAPHSLSNYNPLLKKSLLWGGTPELHALAQEDSWPRILAFLHQHLKSG